MKTVKSETLRQHQFSELRGGCWAAAPVVLAWALAVCSSSGQIFVENWQRYAIGKYTIFGDVVNDPLIWLPNAYRGAAVGMAVDSENHLFIADGANGCVREYTTSGAVVNTLLVTGLDWPLGLVLDGQGHFFVASSGAYGTATGTVGEYSTSGMAINATLISGLSNPMGLALDGKGYLFVACSGDGTIKRFFWNYPGIFHWLV